MRARPVRPMPRNPVIPPQDLTRGMSHPAIGVVDTPGKRGEETDTKAPSPPPPGGRDMLHPEASETELTRKRFAGLLPLWSQLAATVPTTPSPHQMSSDDSQNKPLPLKVAQTMDQNPSAMGMRGGGDGCDKSPSLPPSCARESASRTSVPSNTNSSHPAFPGYAYCNVQNATATKITGKISIQELGVSSMGSLTAIQDVLLASTRAKNKYRLEAEVTVTLIDLCEVQLAMLVMSGKEGNADCRRETGMAETVADHLDAMEKRILSAIAPRTMGENVPRNMPQAPPPVQEETEHEEATGSQIHSLHHHQSQNTTT